MRQSLVISVFSLLVSADLAFGASETHSFTSCDDGIVHRFDPNNGQVCDPLDCGGGRAPIKTDIPGCPAYSCASISILNCWTPSTAIQPAASQIAPQALPQLLDFKEPLGSRPVKQALSSQPPHWILPVVLSPPAPSQLPLPRRSRSPSRVQQLSPPKANPMGLRIEHASLLQGQHYRLKTLILLLVAH
ncbi:hypothetical protein GGI42DRAFT_246666 [Trichoderma sp. SZMC 28013]